MFDVPVTLKKRMIGMLFRITDEQVPLFSSNRLKNLHKDASVLLKELLNEEDHTGHRMHNNRAIR